MRLGGVLVSLFFGMRLIGSVVASKIILGVTVVQTAVQVAGVLLVALAVTAYATLQWRTSRPGSAGKQQGRQQRAWWGRLPWRGQKRQQGQQERGIGRDAEACQS